MLRDKCSASIASSRSILPIFSLALKTLQGLTRRRRRRRCDRGCDHSRRGRLNGRVDGRRRMDVSPWRRLSARGSPFSAVDDPSGKTGEGERARNSLTVRLTDAKRPRSPENSPGPASSVYRRRTHATCIRAFAGRVRPYGTSFSKRSFIGQHCPRVCG